MAPRLKLDARTLRLMLIAFLLLSALTAHRLFFAETPYGADVIVIDGDAMGTTYQIRVAGEGLTVELRDRIEAETQRRLAEIDQWMSNWNPESEISRFNAHHSSSEFKVSSPTAEVVAFAVEVCKWTGGAFDVTIGPVVALWGFGHGARIGEPPTQEEIDELLRHTGGRILRVGRGNRVHGGFIRKGTPETQIDLSAIAKGYGVDHVAAGLFDLERSDFLVEIGGEVRGAGERPGGGPWRVAIEKPQEGARAIQLVVELSEMSMATSGDYRTFYHDEGKRISHIIDPRTGRPVENGPAAATVMTESATVADAWATALMVMGEEGLRLAESVNVAAMLAWRDSSGAISTEMNALFPEMIDPDGGPSDR